MSKGQLTFNSEGNDKKGSKYFSRKPHVPGRWSGVTLGRGYDIGQKLQKQVVKDLVKAGISKTQAEKIAKGAGLKGQKAKNFVKVSKVISLTISGPSVTKPLPLAIAAQVRARGGKSVTKPLPLAIAAQVRGEGAHPL